MTEHHDMPKEVAEAISKVMGSVGYVQKKGTNTFHNYKFAAVGDLLAKVQPAMVEAGLVIGQDELSHDLVAEGAIMVATYAFTLAHTSGATWGQRPRHTGMAGARNTKGGFDDKALNKCHTAARKYFLLALFQIPTGELADPDEDGDHDTAPKQSAAPAPKLPPVPPTGDPKSAAAKWTSDAIETLKGFKSAKEAADWEQSNVKAVQKLQATDPDSYEKLTDQLMAIYDKYNPVSA